MSHARPSILGALALIAACSTAEPARPPVVHIDPPALEAEQPANLPGIHNMVAYAPGLYSGSVPEGDEGFATLEGLGIRTIISVDGALPEVEVARAHGLRYVHLPIGYNGMDESRTLEIAKAIDTLPGPVYVHCHHGKHRSAGAAAAAAVTLGKLTNEQALQRMKVSGTAPNYTGLYKCAADARPASASTLAALPARFPEQAAQPSLVKAMVAIDERFDELKLVEKAGWKAPADHPDLAPASVAGQLADLLRSAADQPAVASKPAEFREALRSGSKQLEALEEGIRSGASAEVMGKRWKAAQQSCKDCHAKFRD